MELCPKCGRMSAQTDLYDGTLVCYHKNCCHEEKKHQEGSKASSITSKKEKGIKMHNSLKHLYSNISGSSDNLYNQTISGSSNSLDNQTISGSSDSLDNQTISGSSDSLDNQTSSDSLDNQTSSDSLDDSNESTKKTKEQSFIDKCLSNQEQPSNIYDYIDQWHASTSRKQLHNFLGMTRDEYAIWLRLPHSLQYILDSRRTFFNKPTLRGALSYKPTLSSKSTSEVFDDKVFDDKVFNEALSNNTYKTGSLNNLYIPKAATIDNIDDNKDISICDQEKSAPIYDHDSLYQEKNVPICDRRGSVTNVTTNCNGHTKTCSNKTKICLKADKLHIDLDNDHMWLLATIKESTFLKLVWTIAFRYCTEHLKKGLDLDDTQANFLNDVFQIKPKRFEKFRTAFTITQKILNRLTTHHNQ